MSNSPNPLTKEQQAIRAASLKVEQAFAELNALIQAQAARKAEGSDESEK